MSVTALPVFSQIADGLEAAHDTRLSPTKYSNTRILASILERGDAFLICSRTREVRTLALTVTSTGGFRRRTQHLIDIAPPIRNESAHSLLDVFGERLSGSLEVLLHVFHERTAERSPVDIFLLGPNRPLSNRVEVLGGIGVWTQKSRVAQLATRAKESPKN